MIPTGIHTSRGRGIYFFNTTLMDCSALWPHNIYSTSEGQAVLACSFALYTFIIVTSSYTYWEAHDAFAPRLWGLSNITLGNAGKQNKDAWRNVGTPKSKSNHFITINNWIQLLSAAEYAVCTIHMSCASLLQMNVICNHWTSIPFVIFAFLWQQLPLCFSSHFGCCEL